MMPALPPELPRRHHATHPTQQQQQQAQFPAQGAGAPRRAPPPTNLQQVPMQSEDVDLKPNVQDMEGKQDDRPAWMKPKLAGVKKIPNKERRRRQNENLRRLLTPKNALMVLNEMMPAEQVSSVRDSHVANPPVKQEDIHKPYQFTVEAAQNQYFSRNTHSYCADLTLDGNNYKGYGENKMSARNNAAEQAIRDLIIKKMNKAVAAAATDSGASDAGGEEEALPMIQLASFALHKLFTEWEEEGHKVPHLKPHHNSTSESMDTGTAAAAEPRAPLAPRSKVKLARTLPANAPAMHPSMLLSYMRPGIEYRELAAEGDKPQNMLFTMGVDVDGATYIGKASNKKEARKAAARAACIALFGLTFEATPTVVKPEA